MVTSNSSKMPQRPRSHEIDTEALEFIRSKLPSRWTRQEKKSDYGTDIEVEIFENNQATGLGFKIQSKGHEDFTIRHSDKIAEQLKVSTLNYFDQLLLPVLLVVYSVKENRACFLWVKPHIQQVLDVEKPNWRDREGDSEITLHIPLNNVFDQTAHREILSHVETETSKLLMQRGGNLPLPILQKIDARHLIASPRVIHPKITYCLHRPRLTDKLTNALSSQSVFLHADAGYGKTWLIHDFITTIDPQIFIWYSFTDETIEAKQFVKEIAAEIFRQTNNCGINTLTYIRDRGKDASSDEAFAILITEIQSSDIQLLLIVENLHLINDNSIFSILESLILSNPPNSQIIISSRIPFPLHQARLIAQSRLSVIGRQEIAFQLDETQEYLDTFLQLELSQEQIRYLHERTDGWIAAVGLAAEAIRETSPQDIEMLFTRLTGFDGNIYDFFAEEVYVRQNEDDKTLLKRLGIVHTINPDVVNLFTSRNDGGQILKDLIKRNSFLIEDESINGNYHLHPLFAEFLETRLRDEEGNQEWKKIHRLLGMHYSENRDWYPATQHAIKAKEYDLAIKGLEIITPVAMNMGYGQAVLTMIDEVPSKWLDQSSLLQEVKGKAALQVGELDLAIESFGKAQELYRTKQDESALNRLSYLKAEASYSNGEISSEDFIGTLNNIALNCYKHNEILLGTQVEIRFIEVGQTLTFQYADLLKQLLDRSESLIERLEEYKGEYNLVKARALAVQAHLLVQVYSFSFKQGVINIHTRQKLGHPISEEDRVAQATTMIGAWDYISNQYSEAEAIAKEESEIEWALIRSKRVSDNALNISMTQFLITNLSILQGGSVIQTLDDHVENILKSCLNTLNECIEIFGKYKMIQALANIYCDAADIFDMMGDIDNRNKYAQEALDMAQSMGLIISTKRAQRILKDEATFSSLQENLNQTSPDKDLATYDKERKAHLVDTILRAYAGETDIKEMREAVESDVDDIVEAAKQRLEWCQHVQTTQDLQHTRSIKTMYRTIPKKRIVCIKLGYQSPSQGYSFEKLWPLFKGGFCLGCLSRSLEA